MSLIFITKHNESIYDICKTDEAQKKASNFSPPKKKKSVKAVEEASAAPVLLELKSVQPQAKTKEHATMGLPEQEPPDPHNYLKKHSGKLSYTADSAMKDGKIGKRIKISRKMKTPLLKDLQTEFNEREKQKAESHKDFLKNNVARVKNMKPKEPHHKIVIDRVGTTILPEAEGLEPVYIKRPIYGRTPKYLVMFNKIKEKEYQMKKDTTGKQQPKCRYITRDERERLLNGLKRNWEELQKVYQGLPILTDTIPKIVKKSKIEADLRQLEKDVVLLERHPYIYVYDDADFY